MAAETPVINEKGVAVGGLTAGHQAVTHQHDSHDSHEAHPPYMMHDMDQQRESITLGMWTFLITEIMMFGGLFFVYTLFRWKFYDEFVAGSYLLDWKLGTVNTCVLLCSSLSMAMAVHAATMRNKKALMGFLLLTTILGVAFLGIKAVEWTKDFHEGIVPGAMWGPLPETLAHLPKSVNLETLNLDHLQMYFIIYFCMTGLHAIHMIIGLAILVGYMMMVRKGAFTDGNDQPVELFGLYWHFVDVVWVFLFPLLYLIGGLNVGSGGGGH
jgi:cytochrome c oxidase subunit 3